MKKRMLRSMLLTCMLVIMLLPTVALAEEHTCDPDDYGICTSCEKHNGSFENWTKLSDWIKNDYAYSNNIAHIYLDSEITTLNKTIPVGSMQWVSGQGHIYDHEKTLYLHLNDNLLTINGPNVTIIASYGTLKIYDSVQKTTRYGQWNNGTYEIFEEAPTTGEYSTLRGGVIYGSNRTGQNCSGGAIDIGLEGNLTMYGGTVAGNQDWNGGGICVAGGARATLDGVTIIDNKTKNWDGGGIYIYNNGTLTISDCTITKNVSARTGGGIHNEGSLEISGCTISDNKSESGGGGIYNLGTLEISGGTITKNIANTATGAGWEYNGGGILCADGTLKLSGNINITDNKKTVDNGTVDHNVYLFRNSKITIEDTLTEDAKIGVTTSTSPPSTFTSGGAAYADNFKSDNPAYRVSKDGSNLKLEKVPYTITTARTENGSVTVRWTSATAGETIAIGATPNDGYMVDSIVVTGDSGNVTVANNRFTMPASNVTVTVTFKKITYAVTLKDEGGETTGGSYSVDKTSAAEGEPVTITVDPDGDYIVDSVEVYGDIVDVTRVDDKTYTFTMPGTDVEVEVMFMMPNLSVTCGNVTDYAENLKWAFGIADYLADETDGAPVTIKVERDYTETINPLSEDIRIVDSSYNNPAITLDLNGKEIHFPETNLYYEDIGMLYITGYDLTLTDTSSEGDGIIHALVTVDGRNNFEEAALDAEPDYDLIVEGGTYRGFMVYTTDTIKISGGTFLGMPQEVVNEMLEDSFASGYAAIIGTKGLLLSNNGGFASEEEAYAALDDIIADGYAANKDYEITEDSYVDNGETITRYFAGFATNTTIGRPITKAETTNGSFAVKVGEDEVKAAATGENVTIKATPANGYEVDTVTVTKTVGGESVEVSGTGNTRTFTMPAEAVTVRVTFKIIPAPAPAPTPSGGSSASTYPVVENKSEDPDGTVKFSSNYSTPGSTVTVTVTPDKYYGVEKVIVRNASGKEIQTTKNADGTYSFKMPYGKVTVEAVYVWENPFVDTKEGAYYINAVEWALKNGITEGTSETTFSPVASCTRAQMVTFLWRAAGCPEPSSAVCDFTDVNVDSYYGKAVLWAIENGITNGTRDGSTFSPDAECSRAQMAAFLCRMADGKAISDKSTFADVKDSAYYAESVQWAVENGITKGTSSNNYSPDATCTRGQMVTFLYRYYVK